MYITDSNKNIASLFILSITNDNHAITKIHLTWNEFDNNFYTFYHNLL